MSEADQEIFMVGLDLGTTGAKAGLVSGSGRVVATAVSGYHISTARAGWAEQDPEDWWAASSRAIRKAIEDSGVDAASIAGVGVSGQMHGSVFLDSRKSVIRPCILWCDSRTVPQCAWIETNVGAANLAKWVGNPALPGFTAPKVLWLRENEPGLFGQVATLLLPKDYLNFRLTGELATEASDASGTLLFDIRNLSWSGPMLDKLGIPVEWLPPVRRSDEIIGTVTAQAADLTGLRKGTPVTAGGADNACGALGMGVTSPGEVAVSIGSSGTVLAPTDEPVVDGRMRLHSFCHAVPDTWYLMGVMLSAGLSLRWFRDNLGEPEVGDAARLGLDSYSLLDETAAKAPAGSDGLIFLPYLNGERTPHADPDARGVLFGLDLTKTRAHVIRSVMEGVAFGLRDSMEIMAELEVPMDEVAAGGGGSRSTLWKQIQADVFNLPLRTAGESDSAMLGAALLAGTAAGVFPGIEEACRACVSYGDTFTPDSEHCETYQNRYETFRSLYPALRELFKDS